METGGIFECSLPFYTTYTHLQVEKVEMQEAIAPQRHKLYISTSVWQVILQVVASSTMPSPSSGNWLDSETLSDDENSPPIRLDVSTNPADLVKVVSHFYMLIVVIR